MDNQSILLTLFLSFRTIIILIIPLIYAWIVASLDGPKRGKYAFLAQKIVIHVLKISNISLYRGHAVRHAQIKQYITQQPTNAKKLIYFKAINLKSTSLMPTPSIICTVLCMTCMPFYIYTTNLTSTLKLMCKALHVGLLLINQQRNNSLSTSNKHFLENFRSLCQAVCFLPM